VPEADIALFKDFIGASEHRRRHCKAARVGGFDAYHEPGLNGACTAGQSASAGPKVAPLTTRNNYKCRMFIHRAGFCFL